FIFGNQYMADLKNGSEPIDCVARAKPKKKKVYFASRSTFEHRHFDAIHHRTDVLQIALVEGALHIVSNSLSPRNKSTWNLSWLLMYFRYSGVPGTITLSATRAPPGLSRLYF